MRRGCGRRVLFVDDGHSTEQKVGETLPGAALRLLRKLSLPTPCCGGPHSQIGGNLSAWNSEELIQNDFIEDPDGPGWRLDRLCFDRTLRKSAIRSGATFLRSNVADVVRKTGSWEVKLHDGSTLTARWLVDATGRRAAIARRMGARRSCDTPLIALYALGKTEKNGRLNRTVIESVPQGWWYAALLPSGAPIAGLHIRPLDASRLASTPGGWHQALSKTHHINSLFSPKVFDCQLRPLDASSTRLDRFVGDEWIACGDAALSFDPLSSQGIFSALHGGMTGGSAVAAALDGQRTLTESYAARLEEVWRIYVTRLQSTYRSESRWRGESFWSGFHISCKG